MIRQKYYTVKINQVRVGAKYKILNKQHLFPKFEVRGNLFKFDSC